MYTTEDLNNAIITGNHNLVEQILAERNKDGIPLVDINWKPYSFGDKPFFIAIQQKPINVDIVKILLGIRDNSGNPVINIRTLSSERSAIYQVMNLQTLPSTKREIVNEILNTRLANGQFIVDIAAEPYPLLHKAVCERDFELFRLLTDIRNVDGSHALAINQMYNLETVLDLVLCKHSAADSDASRAEWLRWIELILQLGGLRSTEIILQNIGSSSQVTRNSSVVIRNYRFEKSENARWMAAQMLNAEVGQRIRYDQRITIQPNAITEANEIIISVVGSELMTLPISEQAEILSKWNIDESKSTEFKQQMVAAINNKLIQYFGVLLTEEDRKKITDELKFLPRPKVPHQKLNELVDEFDNHFLLTDESSRSKAARNLRNYALNIYYDESTSHQQKYEKLLKLKNNFHTLDALSKAFSTLKMEYLQNARNQQPNPLRVKDIELIDTYIQNANLKYQKDYADPNFITNLLAQIRNIANRMTLLGFNISNSSLYPLINQKLNTIVYSTNSAKQGKNVPAIEQNGSNNVKMHSKKVIPT